MRKFLSVTIVLVMLCSIALAESNNWTNMTDEELIAAIEAAQAELDRRNNDNGEETANDTMEIPDADAPILSGSGWEISKEYFFNQYGTYYYFFVLKNTCGYNAAIGVDVIFYDANDNIVGADEGLEYGCENGYETFWSFTNDIAFDHVSVNISMDKDEWNIDGSQSALEYSYSIVGDKIIISAKNIGTEAIEYPMYEVLFLNDKGEVVYSDWGYMSQNDDKINPNTTQICDVSSYEKFTDAIVYVHGTISRY
ncbi:MAG: hypothetical protein Q4C10_11795 [Clostridia bacterium]|nr:hypothetical protein [Clostridia bacterium]